MSYNLVDKIPVPTQTSLLAVKDTPYVSGNFILTHLLHSYLKSNQSVCFVTLEHSFFHYTSVTRKMGSTNLQDAQSKGLLHFINGLSSPYDWTQSVVSSSNNSGIEDIKFNSSTKNLEELYKSIKRYIETVKGGCSIIIDNLNLLLTLTDSPSEVLDLLNYCFKLVSAKEQASSLVVCIHDEGSEVEKLIESLYYTSPMNFTLFRVQGLESGFSREISGQVTISKTSKSEGGKKWYFKLLDTGIKLYTPGFKE